MNIISNITLYLTSKCNLQCKYCYIEKHQDFLNKTDISIAGNLLSYWNQVLNFNENIKYTLQSLTFWGGEPFLEFDRIYSVVPFFLKECKFLNTFYFFTNFTIKNEVNKLQQFINFLQDNYKRKFIIDLQLSIDGPSFINDKNRGEGSTQKFINNFNLLRKLKFNDKQIQIRINFKPTLLKEDLYLLSQYNNLNQYFKFFEQFGYDGMWTFAAPQEWNKEDGKLYVWILSEIKKSHKIIPESTFKKCQLCTSILNNLTPVGNDQYCLCHRGYFDDINNRKIYTKEELLNLQNIFKSHNKNLIKENFIKEIQLAAFNKQIDQKYLNRENIIPTLNILITKNCPYNNYIYNGNFLYPLTNEIPLYYNGAIDIILKERN